MKAVSRIAILLLFLAPSTRAEMRLAPSLFHFNVQYVAGDKALEHKIITDSLHPLLEIVRDMPGCVVDIEIQGYGLELMDASHRETLDLLRDLIRQGKVELVATHYSDQLYIAYPGLDMEKSLAITGDLCRELHLPRSRIFCSQEIQWCPGLPLILGKEWDAIVISGSPINHYVSGTSRLSWAKMGDKRTLVLQSGDDSVPGGPQWTWSFFDDGETFNTFTAVNDFDNVPFLQALRAGQLKRLLDEGTSLCTISHLLKRVLPKAQIGVFPYVPEGTWRMGEGKGPYNWMGRLGSMFEKDGHIRAIPYEARGWVLAAETLRHSLEASEVSKALADDLHQIDALLIEAWKALLLSEVSDSSGWSPRPIEVTATPKDAQQARDLAFQVMESCLPHLPTPPLFVSTRDGRVQRETAEEPRPFPTKTDPPIQAAVLQGEGRLEWAQIAENLFECVASLTPVKRGKRFAVEIAFPTDPKSIQCSPPLAEDLRVPLGMDLKNDPYLALSNGWLHLGNEWSLVKDCTVGHVACCWRRQDALAVFREERPHGEEPCAFRFLLVKGNPQEGHAVAQQLNTWPRYSLRSKDGKPLLVREDFRSP